ncbi:uncharacterized protein LY89DRAFT_762950, partial [Mollisia scopiformis]
LGTLQRNENFHQLHQHHPKPSSLPLPLALPHGVKQGPDLSYKLRQHLKINRQLLGKRQNQFPQELIIHVLINISWDEPLALSLELCGRSKFFFDDFLHFGQILEGAWERGKAGFEIGGCVWGFVERHCECCLWVGGWGEDGYLHTFYEGRIAVDYHEASVSCWLSRSKCSLRLDLQVSLSAAGTV